jgi:hypothetical protein
MERDMTVTQDRAPVASAQGPDVLAVATSAATPDPDRQQLRWGPVWAGVLSAFGVFALLSLLAIALGLQEAPGLADQDLGITASIITSAITLIAFFVGGYISAWSANLSDPGRGLLNGFLVWALFLAIVVVLAFVGLGTLVGAAATMFDQVIAPPTDVSVDPAQALQVIKDSAWTSLLALALTAASAALGGVVGVREDVRSWGTAVYRR